MGKRIDTCICITESLCCTPETNTTLLIDYTSIENKNLKKERGTKVLDRRFKMRICKWTINTLKYVQHHYLLGQC